MPGGLFAWSRGVACLAALAAVALIAGCGGGDDTTVTVTKAEFIKQANTICTEARLERDEAVEELSKGKLGEKNVGDPEVLLDVALPPIKEMATHLNELEPPAGLEDDVDAIVSGFEKGVAEAEADPEAVLGGDNPLLATEQLAKKFGLTACSTI